MARLLTLFLVLTSFNIVKADCLACWELRKVEITLSGGEVVTGYVAWNESWIADLPDFQQWQNKFPESLIHYYQSFKQGRKIPLYKELFKIKNDSIKEFIATRKDCILNLDCRQVVTLRELDKSTKKHEGAGELPIFTRAEIEKLKTNPFAVLEIDDPVVTFYFLSYNAKIKTNQLKKITTANLKQKAAELKNEGVIVYRIGHD